MAIAYDTALAIVPPAEEVECWDKLQSIRYKLQDKGYYRWPPHINLLYPFVESDLFPLVLPQIADAIKDISPFSLTLERFGTFGGKRKGVCWLNPTPTEPIHCLYRAVCESSRIEIRRQFQPHLTVSHYHSVNEAKAVALEEEPDWEAITFHVRYLYALRRDGPNGQYYVACQIPLQGVSDGPEYFELGMRFPGMPETEDDWVKDRRKK